MSGGRQLGRPHALDPYHARLHKVVKVAITPDVLKDRTGVGTGARRRATHSQRRAFQPGRGTGCRELADIVVLTRHT